MFTAISTALAAFFARKGVKDAIAVAPYVAALIPLLTLAVALLVAYFHGDAVSRAMLVLVVLNEAVVGGIALYLAKIYLPKL